MEKPIYPSPYMRITQGYNEGTHVDSFAIDEAGMDSGIDYILAPFTGVIKKIYTTDANEVWLESIDKVEYPDGTIDYMTVMFAHANDVDNLFIGKKINQKERFYFEGTKGNASGNHCHIECGQGKFTGIGWHANSNGYWVINNGKRPEDCLWIDETIKILDSKGYNFKKIVTSDPSVNNDNINQYPEEKDDSVTEPPKDNPDDITSDNNNNNNPSTTIKHRLIFSCQKTDIYALNLKQGDKLYLERKE